MTDWLQEEGDQIALQPRVEFADYYSRQRGKTRIESVGLQMETYSMRVVDHRRIELVDDE
jgi:hypothetical protein